MMDHGVPVWIDTCFQVTDVIQNIVHAFTRDYLLHHTFIPPLPPITNPGSTPVYLHVYYNIPIKQMVELNFVHV